MNKTSTNNEPPLLVKRKVIQSVKRTMRNTAESTRIILTAGYTIFRSKLATGPYSTLARNVFEINIQKLTVF